MAKTGIPLNAPRRLGYVLTAAVVIAAASAASAPAQQGAAGVLGRASIDGSGVDRSFAVLGPTGNPGQVAVDSGHLYWTQNQAGRIGRAAIGGSPVEPNFVTGLSLPQAVAAAAAYVYWVAEVPTAGTSVLQRALPDGSARETLPVGDNPRSVWVDDSYVYWSTFNAIGRANLDGSGAIPGFVSGIRPSLLAVGGGSIYWIDVGGNGAGKIGRANIDGSSPNRDLITNIAHGSTGLTGLAVDGSHVYWAQPSGISIAEAKTGGPAGRGTISRANLDGTSVEERFIPGIFGLHGLAVDAKQIYWFGTFDGTLPGPADGPPAYGKRVTVRVLAGTVRVRPAGSQSSQPLGATTQVSMGSTLDARNGSIEIVAAANASGRQQRATLTGAAFGLTQKSAPHPAVVVKLIGGNFAASCRGAGTTIPIRRLAGTTTGSWRIDARRSATTAGAATWVVEDRCLGTATRVSRGAVSARNLTTKHVTTVRGGHTYLATRSR